ncbi:hypothetical protein FaHV1S18_007 [Falconid herpesvirus 1]|uniref:Uncharacterized protein n=2 Tax=Columbid alphaherpesvirus 1 TaxID=93386 RepID=A0A068ER00_9ALPH|nr:hypothetical protein FaHV1S18_007 [Falconid herpesvirus 1]YP_009352901.1 hypothetical protein CoHVHLJ_007 [Columbid alphaherpesvirus 1]AID52697.1 hypothetical protein FaHV1S18_007 [Falconid herpesvirus 1]ARD71318.1 hypothetical protein CoHVHLJ_007 [Columbid alphaherpesvirus 1]
MAAGRSPFYRYRSVPRVSEDDSFSYVSDQDSDTESTTRLIDPYSGDYGRRGSTGRRRVGLGGNRGGRGAKSYDALGVGQERRTRKVVAVVGGVLIVVHLVLLVVVSMPGPLFA